VKVPTQKGTAEFGRGGLPEARKTGVRGNACGLLKVVQGEAR